MFSFIKKFRDQSDFVLPDRARVTMDKYFLNSYVVLLIETCHRRGIHAMGGMAAQIPIRGEEGHRKVRQDKLREVKAGRAPGLVPVAKDIFGAFMKGPNQIHIRKQDGHIAGQDPLTVPEGEITEHGLRANIDIDIQYLESWLRGTGCMPTYNLMEDAATAEISSAQVWQWLKHGVE